MPGASVSRAAGAIRENQWEGCRGVMNPLEGSKPGTLPYGSAVAVAEDRANSCLIDTCNHSLDRNHDHICGIGHEGDVGAEWLCECGGRGVEFGDGDAGFVGEFDGAVEDLAEVGGFDECAADGGGGVG